MKIPEIWVSTESETIVVESLSLGQKPPGKILELFALGIISVLADYSFVSRAFIIMDNN